MWRYISTGPWRIVVIHPVNSRNWLWISPVTTRYICTFTGASLTPQQALHITIIILFWQCTHNCVHVHTQGQHSKCPSISPCHTPAYTPSKIKLDNEKAIESLRQQLKSTYIYRSAEDFCRVRTTCTVELLLYVCLLFKCRDTYWVESFNHQLLTYLPKRIHFSTVTFNMRMNLAVLDWVRMFDNFAWHCTCTLD